VLTIGGCLRSLIDWLFEQIIIQRYFGYWHQLINNSANYVTTFLYLNFEECICRFRIELKYMALRWPFIHALCIFLKSLIPSSCVVHKILIQIIVINKFATVHVTYTCVSYLTYAGIFYKHRVSKNCANFFCHNFVKFPPTLIIFGTLIPQRINLCNGHLFFTSFNSRQRPTVLNADVSNCYITL